MKGLSRKGRPFLIVDIDLLKKGQEKAVIAVKLADNLVDVYIIEERAFIIIIL